MTRGKSSSQPATSTHVAPASSKPAGSCGSSGSTTAMSQRPMGSAYAPDLCSNLGDLVAAYRDQFVGAHLQHNHSVPAGRACDGTAMRPATGHPDRDPRQLRWPGQEYGHRPLGTFPPGAESCAFDQFESWSRTKQLRDPPHHNMHNPSLRLGRRAGKASAVDEHVAGGDPFGVSDRTRRLP
jgi:hypothetical protein